MKIKNRLNQSLVVGFFVGIVVTVIFNWIVFKDPKHITAPGVAALVAMCTFTLALWSAFKVNKWINTKVNEKGFKKCEEILDNISKGITYLLKTDLYVKKIFDLNAKEFTSSEHDLIKAQHFNDNFIEEADKMDILLLDIVSLQHQLKIWGFSIDKKHNPLKLYDSFVKYRESVAEAFEMINTANPDSHGDFIRMKNKTSDIYTKMISYNRDIFSSEFNSIFKEITSPSKKVD